MEKTTKSSSKIRLMTESFIINVWISTYRRPRTKNLFNLKFSGSVYYLCIYLLLLVVLTSLSIF